VTLEAATPCILTIAGRGPANRRIQLLRLRTRRFPEHALGQGQTCASLASVPVYNTPLLTGARAMSSGPRRHWVAAP
jgi:hypothetical protein